MLNIAIVGLGVMGGSFAKALNKQKEFAVNIMGIDYDEETLKKALDDKIISIGERKNNTILQKADLIIITLYPNDVINFIKENKKYFKKDAIITDITGIKSAIIMEVQKEIHDYIDFIFGHPMAGRENRGYDYSDDTVFIGSNYLIMSTGKNKAENLDKFEKIIRALGFTRITYIDANKHDEMIAYTSQLCHVIAVSLINSDRNLKDTVRFAGDSFRDLTRIAKINEILWSELFIKNKKNLLKSIDNFGNEIKLMKEAIQNEDKETLEKLFIESTKRRIYFEENDKRKK